IPGGRHPSLGDQQIKEPLFSRKIHSGARNRPSPASVEWGGLRRFRAHRDKVCVRPPPPNGNVSASEPDGSRFDTRFH
ncbi:hypothetical protein AVEN_73071-1, partial [Araneus ventricosus]